MQVMSFAEAEISSKFLEEFGSKLEVNELEEKLPPPEEEEEENEEEFSFVCLNPDGSPISADDIFHNGQIRPVFPLFNRDLLFANGDLELKHSSEPSLRPPLKKLFVEDRDQGPSTSSSENDEPAEGAYCAWTGKAVEASPGVCKKSNSTGFSKLRRFRELVLRSNSDGKDAFLFLNHKNHNHSQNRGTKTSGLCKKSEKRSEKVEEEKQQQKVVVVKKKVGKSGETAASVHERLYVKSRAIKEDHKRKSYLPYRVGFFTNVNGLSRNVHPY